MNDKVYFSNINTEIWHEIEYMRYIIVPRRWWSIKDWLLAEIGRKFGVTYQTIQSIKKEITWKNI